MTHSPDDDVDYDAHTDDDIVDEYTRTQRRRLQTYHVVIACVIVAVFVVVLYVCVDVARACVSSKSGEWLST